MAKKKKPDEKALRRERRAERRRTEILTAALRVFEKVGYDAASIKLIALEADISEGTIYNYFPDKGELCIQALKEWSGLAVLTDQMQRTDIPLDDALTELGRWRAKQAPLQSALMELMAEILARPKLRERYRTELWEPAATAVEIALKRERGTPDAQDLDARIFLSALMGLWLMSLADKKIHKLLTSNMENALASVHAALLTRSGSKHRKSGPASS